MSFSWGAGHTQPNGRRVRNRHRAPGRSHSTLIKFGAAGAAIVTIVAVVAATAWNSGQPASPAAAGPVAPVEVAEPAAQPSTLTSAAATPTPVVEFLTLIVDQRVEAGRDVQPGLWATTGGQGCRWSRDAGTTWSRVGHPRQAVTVSLSPGAVFETWDCAPWKRLP